jgi:putative endonuclease
LQQKEMYIFNKHWYYGYIVTNPERAVLYIGVTNNLEQRLIEHYSNKGNPKTFAVKHYCYNLVYYEEFQYVRDAIAREKELKAWSRKKKDDLIRIKNKDFTFLNGQVCIQWPPREVIKRF